MTVACELYTVQIMNNGETLDPPRLIGKKVYLRPIEPADVDGPYLDWLNDPEVTHYLAGGRPRQTRQTLLDYLSRFEHSDMDIIFAICDRGSDRHIGNVTLNNINKMHGTADSGIMIGAKDYWGKGYGFEAWSLLLDHAFNRLGLRKVISGCVAENRGSLELQKKLGFEIEGTFRKEVYLDGEYRDVIRTGLFRENFVPPGQ